MKVTGPTMAILLVTISLSISACAAPSIAPDLTAPVGSTLVPPTEVLAEATVTPKSTQGPTATIWPPVFDPAALGDTRELDSFIVTINEKNTVNGQLDEVTTTIGYIQEPYSVYQLVEFSGWEAKTYVIDGRTYEVNNGGDWYISAGTNDDDLFFKADILALNMWKLVDAQFAGQEDYQGIPANHFILDQTNSTTESNANVELEGDFFLAQESNFVIYSHWKETSTQENFKQVYEVTEVLSSINQLTEITVPADIQEMVSPMDLPIELSLPLPPDSAQDGMIRYKFGIGVDYYFFTTPKTSIEEFLEYYRNLTPTDGWTVSHVGKVSLHENDCEFSAECVIINKGSTQVILYYNGATIRAEFDWPHLFSPL